MQVFVGYMQTVILLVFASVALFLASIGLYGVMSFLITQRTREFGIRLAVGANTGDILRLVLRHAAKLVIIGISLGLFGRVSLSGARVLRLVAWNEKKQ